MKFSQDEFNKALGLQSSSSLTQEQAAAKILEAFNEQDREIDELKKLYQKALSQPKPGGAH